jgi:hypothetical protein
LAVFAKVAELVDALDLGSSAYGVGVRVPPFAPVIPGCMTAKNLNLSLIQHCLTAGFSRKLLIIRGVAGDVAWHEF